MSADREDLKKEKPQPHGLRKLAPNDFDEEMNAIKNGLHHVAEKFHKDAPVAEGQPVPVDQLGKRSAAQTFAAIGHLIKSALPDAAERSARGHAGKKEKIVVDFEEEEASSEKMGRDEQSVAPHKLPAAANKAKEVLKSGALRLASEKNREMGRIAAGAAAEGFGTAFHGVAEGARALRRAVENRFPKTNRIFHAVGIAFGTSLSAAGKVARAAGKGLASAGRGAAEKLKELKDSGAFENAKDKLGQSASSAMQGLSRKGKNAGERLGKAASGAATGLKNAARNAGERLGALKEKAEARREERRAAREAAGTLSAGKKLKVLSEKASSRFKSMRSELSEKARKIAADAKSTLHRDHLERSGREEGNPATLCQFADSISAKAKGVARRVRAQTEKSVCAGEGKQPDESAPLSEKLRGWKDKMTLGAKDLAAKAKSRFDALRAPEEETSGNPPEPQTPAVLPTQPRQPVSPADDVNDYAAEETVAPDLLRQKDDEEHN
ncbi:MAG: hypothetical protein SOY64_07275 [Pyramidobacter sp.]|uniref:hypothetical protein n=1 Tax=Pyramidobacter sp. TaxID=1943581 RepID=UPI002A7F1584|nr:hypothetical protein [Pyramidobacter sp.]MDY4032840.1 hypothetical protein [Pyramidobacter sp.]